MRRRNAAIVGAITVLCIAIIASRRARPSGGMDLSAAIRRLSCRPLEARLSELPYAPAPRTGDRARLWEAGIRRIDGSPASLVLIGNRDGAKLRLEEMTSRKDATAAAWSDYAALLHDSAAPGDAFALTTALAAADHALDIDPLLPEALFNRGVILETLSFRTAAATAYNDYLRVDRASQWSGEVKDRLKRLRSPSTAPRRRSIVLFDLLHAAASGDVLFINDAVITSPEQMRRFADGALVQWGHRTLAHDASATEMLNLARILGASFENQAGDAILAETVRAIDAATDPEPLAKAHVALAKARRLSLADVAHGEVGNVSLHHPLLPTAFAASPGNKVLFGEALELLLELSMHHVKDPAGRMSLPRSRAACLRESERLFAAHDSPMELVARYETFTSPDLRRGLIDELSRRTPPRYRLLTAHIESMRAWAFVRDGLAREALASLQAAHDTYQQLGEEWHTQRTRDALAAVYSSIGDAAEAWRLRSERFQWISERQNDRQLTYAMYLAASDALRGNRFDLAHSLLNVVGDSEVFDGIRDEALIWRAAAANSAGLKRTARRHLDLAQSVLRTRTDKREDLTAESLIVAGLIDGSPERAAIWFDRFLKSERDRHAEDGSLALRGLSRHFVRQFFLTQPFDSFRLLAAEQDRAGKTLEAIKSLDLYRLQDRFAGTLWLDPERWYREIPRNTVLISYGVFDRHLVIYAAHANGVERASVTLPAPEVERLTVSFSQALQSRDERASRVAGNALYRVLIAPVANIVAKAHSIVVVPDPSMRQIPFSALMQSNGRYLVQDHAVAVPPSITSYRESLRTERARSRAVLAVGNPLLSESLKSLRSLREAEAEAQEIAAMYPSRALLVRGDATKQRVVSALAYCDVAHFAVHAAVSLNDVTPPHLLLSESSDDDGRLSASEVAELRLGGVRTVVLAACRTAVATPRRPETRSLVDAFLTAGAGSVIGALWEIDDGITREMSVEIHRVLRSGETPAAALRAAQLLMIGSKTNARSPSEWAGLQLYGSGL
ncbi:MAG TPA: CHAT domain-containing protein [Thermoanaerobaculia bacterium]|jgi:CHAT domain-containing protein|nr:CHAT domain-containing protein [Thermoanaerobaculia bacterium]